MSEANENRIVLGQTLGRKPGRLFGIGERDRLHHQLGVGQTGTGKTTLLANMIRQDIRLGNGLCLIDPHGDLARSLKDSDKDRLIYWDVADPACPYGYNPLASVSAPYRPLVASGLIDTLKRQWSDAWGARMEHLLRYALLALLERPRSTLKDVLPLFLDKVFRAEVVASVTDEEVCRFWSVEYKAMRYQTSIDGVAPIANKLGAFLAHPVVRKAVCEPRVPLRFRTIMDEEQVLIVNLAKGRLGADTANIVGGLVVASIALAAYSRQDQPEAERRPFFLYIDEFHSFTTEAFADMLSELRKYGLGLVLTTQHISARLSTEAREAIWGNVGTIIAFRVGATDADLLAKQFGTDVPRPRDLLGLANYEVFIKLIVSGKQTKPFSAMTLAAILN